MGVGGAPTAVRWGRPASRYEPGSGVTTSTQSCTTATGSRTARSCRREGPDVGWVPDPGIGLPDGQGRPRIKRVITDNHLVLPPLSRRYGRDQGPRRHPQVHQTHHRHHHRRPRRHPDAENVVFSFKETVYTVDLSSRNQQKLQKALEPFISAGTVVSGPSGPSRSSGRPARRQAF